MLDLKLTPANKQDNPVMYRKAKLLRHMETNLCNEVVALQALGEDVRDLVNAVEFLNRQRNNLITKHFL